MGDNMRKNKKQAWLYPKDIEFLKKNFNVPIGDAIHSLIWGKSMAEDSLIQTMERVAKDYINNTLKDYIEEKFRLLEEDLKDNLN